ncbi:ankyrin, partial [Glonium stellatum]
MKPEDISQINSAGETLLHEAVRLGIVNIVRLLLEAGADANIEDNMRRLPIHWACANYGAKFDGILSIILDYTDDPNYRDRSGETPLQLAARHDRTEAVVRLLTEEKVEVDVPNPDGQTALYVAAKKGYEAVARVLIQNRADINTKEQHGGTALYM